MPVGAAQFAVNNSILTLVTQCAEHHDNNVVLGNDPQMTVNA